MAKFKGMKRFLKNNGLSVVMLGLFAVFWVGQSLAGWLHYNHDQQEHGQASVSWGKYVTTGDFIESTFENWESEFLQMAAFLIFSTLLIQRGSSESKKPNPAQNEQDKDPRRHRKPDSPGPVHRGGFALAVYSQSLTLALLGLFLFSFVMHAVGGVRVYNEEALGHGQAAIGLLAYLGSSTFWFESLQNWQSEFLSIGALVVLSIFLRTRGSPQSKAVQAAHSETGSH